MSCLIGKLNLILAVTVIALVSVACGSVEEPAPEREIAVESLAVPEATPTHTAAPSPVVQAASPLATPTLELSTEIIEPVSPVSTAEAAMSDSTNRSLTPAPGSEEAVAAAVADLAQQQGVPVDTITVQSVEPMEWGDASLGCPQEGFMYAQVITPGYLIILETQGQTYEYHTDAQGQNVVLCEQ